MNNKKAKQIRRFLELVAEGQIPKEEIRSQYQKLKKHYQSTPKKKASDNRGSQIPPQ